MERYGVYWRQLDQAHWTLAIEDEKRDDAAQLAKRIVGMPRGRYFAHETVVLTFDGTAPIPLFVPVGRERVSIERHGHLTSIQNASPQLYAAPKPLAKTSAKRR